MQTRIISLFFLTIFAFTQSFAQGTKSEKATEPTEEELAQIALAEHREKLMEEMLPNTRALIFIDSLVVDKDDFFSRLRLTRDIGQFTLPEQALGTSLPSSATTGRAAFINSLNSAAFFSVADSLGNMRLAASYRNSGHWTEPQILEELTGFDYQDFPFLHTDGSTLYFAASGEESIGGLDIFATRFNDETRQFVRPQNMGFPYNSEANDYLLAIDEEAGIGALVSDRNQADDKVCIYWFIVQELHEVYDYDLDDEEAEAIVKGFAAISSIEATQVGSEQEVAKAKARWAAALKNDVQPTTTQYRFVINDATVYTSLEQFKNEAARDLAQQWVSESDNLTELEARQDALRQTYATNKSEETAQALRELETKIAAQRAKVRQLAKDYRAAELK